MEPGFPSELRSKVKGVTELVTAQVRKREALGKAWGRQSRRRRECWTGRINTEQNGEAGACRAGFFKWKAEGQTIPWASFSKKNQGLLTSFFGIFLG